MNLIEFGELLHNKRIELKLSLREASNLLNISHNYLSIMEKAIDPKSGMPIKPTIDTLILISDGYNMDINYLLELCGYDFAIKTKEDDKEISQHILNKIRKIPNNMMNELDLMLDFLLYKS